MNEFIIEPKKYKIEDFSIFLKFNPIVKLSEKSTSLIVKSRKKLEYAVKSGQIIYGVNTGFGKLSQVQIPDEQIAKLQENLVLSHATGLGKPISDRLVRLIILTKINLLGRQKCLYLKMLLPEVQVNFI